MSSITMKRKCQLTYWLDWIGFGNFTFHVDFRLHDKSIWNHSEKHQIFLIWISISFFLVILIERHMVNELLFLILLVFCSKQIKKSRCEFSHPFAYTKNQLGMILYGTWTNHIQSTIVACVYCEVQICLLSRAWTH